MSARSRSRPTVSRKQRRAHDDRREASQLLLVGSSQRADQVDKALARLDVGVIRAAGLPERVTPGTLAIVLVAPLEALATAEEAVARLRTGPSAVELPLFAVVDDDTPDRTVRTIYATGATAVFQWPREALLLPRLVAELLGVSSVRGRARKPQAALTRTLRAHLRLVPRSTADVGVTAIGGGEVLLSGSIATYWRKQELERLVARVPGVTRIRSDALHVEPTALTDRQVASAVRSTLRGTKSVDPSTVSVSVVNGSVALAGTVSDRAELSRIEELVAHVSGVRGITNSLVVCDSIRQRDGSTARRLKAMLGKWFPRDAIEIAVFARCAVVSGRVRGLSRRLEIERFVDREPAIVRVINKLEVV